MDKLELYRSIVTEILNKYSQYKPSYGQVEIEQIFDRDRDRYQLLAIGWNQQKRIYGTTIHLDIQDEKIWIQQNTTEFDLASDLVEMGVPKQDIVIGFHTPKMRQLTGH
ncbi:XisI protein [Chamaesiphon sp. VAR_48_metabat_403]|uniref:XisI protein n=1 Tax=Chamaesiphon sp. VAR_48_metabat_403 TaxID=2964700 RepID=UPI00286EAA43|nr:XisI protein [Chamaesiphon sp. VAR_48_metabat_403]